MARVGFFGTCKPSGCCGVAEASGPDLHGHHGLLGADGGQQVLLGQELQRELDQESADPLQLLASPDRVLLLQARLGEVSLQLQDATDVAGRKTSEDLEEERRGPTGAREGLQTGDRFANVKGPVR